MRNIQKGFTLLEAMIVVAIIGIIASIAVPSYQDVLERNRIKDAAESLRADLQWTRTEAIKKSCPLKVVFDNSVWNYKVYELDGVCPCQSDGTCTCPADGNDCVMKTVTVSQYPGVTMGTASFWNSGSTAWFDFRRGTTSHNGSYHNGGVIFNTDKYQLKVVVSINGRVRICNSDSSKKVPGYDC